MNGFLKSAHKNLQTRLKQFCARLEMVDSFSEDASLADSYINSWVTSKHAQLMSRHTPKFDKYMNKLEECGFFEHGLLEIISRGLIRQFGKEGILKYMVPRQYGGVGKHLDVISLCLIRQSLSYYSSLADTVFAIQGLGSYPITMAGSASQKRKYLPKITTGELIPAFALTESGAGSDISSMETTAISKGKSYHLKGTKTFISNVGIAHFYTVFARVGKKSDSLAVFVVDARAKGLKITKRIDVMAPHPIGEVSFNCVIPADSRIGQPGDGFSIAVKTLETFRTSVGAAALGMARRAFDEALSYTQSRKQFGRRISDFQAVKFQLAEMATMLKASEVMVFNSAFERNNGAGRIEASMAKLYATETAQKIIDMSLQLHGGIGVVKGSTIERLYREIRALRIYEGTSEIQKVIIAKRLLS